MAQKKLQTGSKYSKYDTDGDGIVSDEELKAAKEKQALELEEKDQKVLHRKQTAQRRMATGVLVFMALYTLAMFMPFIPDERIKLLTDLSNLLYITGGGIVGAYMGVAAWMARKK